MMTVPKDGRDRILIKTGTGVSKPWLIKEIDDIKKMLDELPNCINSNQLINALDYCEHRIVALKKLAGSY